MLTVDQTLKGVEIPTHDNIVINVSRDYKQGRKNGREKGFGTTTNATKPKNNVIWMLTKERTMW